MKALGSYADDLTKNDKKTKHGYVSKADDFSLGKLYGDDDKEQVPNLKDLDLGDDLDTKSKSKDTYKAFDQKPVTSKPKYEGYLEPLDTEMSSSYKPKTNHLGNMRSKPVSDDKYGDSARSEPKYREDKLTYSLTKEATSLDSDEDGDIIQLARKLGKESLSSNDDSKYASDKGTHEFTTHPLFASDNNHQAKRQNCPKIIL